MKHFLLGFLLALSLGASESMDLNKSLSEASSSDFAVVKDNSGLSDAEVRKIATAKDKVQKKEQVSLKDVYEVTDTNGSVDMSRLQLKWSDLSPVPNKYDWIQTKSKEWFKGEIKAMYDKSLEFDSDEIGLYSFDFEDVVQIKSFHPQSVHIENIASFQGIVRLKDSEIRIIQGENEFVFKKSQIVSFAPDGERERHNWSGKITLSLDKRAGNKDQFDYTAKFNIKRRTDNTRLVIDYLGRFSKVSNIETANDHRLNEKFDIYINRRFFITPVFAEYYQDKFQNINKQYTVGLGIGYTLVDTSKIELDFSGGPAVIYTEYANVSKVDENSAYSPALELSSKLKIELNSVTDLKYDYKLTYTDSASGTYKHHMVFSLENELTGWLDLDFTTVWDYISNPETRADNTTPTSSDFQFLLGLGVEF
jgi:putative salt-induced outer membrane protein YdiY